MGRASVAGAGVEAGLAADLASVMAFWFRCWPRVSPVGAGDGGRIVRGPHPAGKGAAKGPVAVGEVRAKACRGACKRH